MRHAVVVVVVLAGAGVIAVVGSCGYAARSDVALIVIAAVVPMTAGMLIFHDLGFTPALLLLRLLGREGRFALLFLAFAGRLKAGIMQPGCMCTD